MGNRKFRYRKSLELWNFGTLEPSNPFLNPLRGNDSLHIKKNLIRIIFCNYIYNILFFY